MRDSSVGASFPQAPVFDVDRSSVLKSVRVFEKVHCFVASLSIHQSVLVFDTVHCLFCNLQYQSVHACVFDKVH